MARVLITGVTGQIGSFAAEQLVAAGHDVLGVSWPLDAAFPNGVHRCATALTPSSAQTLIDECGELDAVIHLAGFASVAQSWQDPVAALTTNTDLTAALVHALRGGRTRLVHASSGEIFGRAALPLLDESTPIAPLSPYGVSKAAAHMLVRLGRDAYRAPMTNLILFLAESERRGQSFVFRKITRGLAAVHLGLADHLSLGDTSVIRDFCHASDFASAFVMLALGSPPGDYVCASGEAHSIADVASTACGILGLDPGSVLRTDPALLRPADIPSLVGNSARLRSLGWAPRFDFRTLVKTIIDHDLAQLRAEATAPR